MTRVNPVIPADANEQVSGMFAEIKSAFGVVPKMFQVTGNSPAALASMWGSFGALGAGTLDSKLGEQIAVAVANVNTCEYCLSAHTALGRKAGASQHEMSDAQVGVSSDPKTAAALTFALALVEKRGHVSDADMRDIAAAGYSEGEIVEIVAHVALNLFTNYINVALEVPNDFPVVAFRDAEAAAA